MRYEFRNKKVLVVNSDNVSRKLLMGVLRVLCVGTIKDAIEASSAYRAFNLDDFDAIIAEIDSGTDDVIPLAKKIRTAHDSKNPKVPIIALCGKGSLPLIDRAREAGVTDLIRAPYSTDVVAETLNYVFSLHGAELDNYIAESAMAPHQYLEYQASAGDKMDEIWPEEKEAASTTNMLLDHYIKHNEVVLSKLKFAQDATQKCMDEMRSVYNKAKSEDRDSMKNFGEFDKMWEDIIEMFVNRGVSEDDMFKIESVIKTIPANIKEHYDELTQQDEEFLEMLDNLNTSAYKKAKAKVMTLHATPNPLNGKTFEDYNVKQEGLDVMDIISGSQVKTEEKKSSGPADLGPYLIDPKTGKVIQ